MLLMLCFKMMLDALVCEGAIFNGLVDIRARYETSQGTFNFKTHV